MVVPQLVSAISDSKSLKSILTVLAVAVCSTVGCGQEGRVFDDLSMTSEILKGQRKFSI